MPERDVVFWNAILSMYIQNGDLKYARKLFDEMPERNVVSWNAILTGYCHCGLMREALGVFLMMHRSGLWPHKSIFVAVIGLGGLELVENLRTVVIKTGYEGDVVVDTAILNAYTRNGCLDSAFEFFQTMQDRNEYSSTRLITAYAQKGRIQEARLIFDEIPNPGVVSWNAMVAGYAQNEMVEEAKDMFRRMPVRNSVSWAALIAGLMQNGQSVEALELFGELLQSGNVPSHSCVGSALFACAKIGAVEVGRQIHSLAIKTRCQFNSYVGNGLISMYAKCKNMEDVSQVFSTMKVRDTVSWNTLIARLLENDMLDDARNTFEKMPTRDVVSWNAIISAYVQAGNGNIALELFLDMLAGGMKPNQLTVTSLLNACGSMGATKLGEQTHALIFKLGLDSCLFVCNALVTMYFKCGCLDGMPAGTEPHGMQF